MKSETDPITDDEWLLRRVPAKRFRAEESPLISPNSFEPRLKGNDIDVDGISLYREACLSSPDEVLATMAADKICQWGVVRIPVSLVKSLDFSVKIRPDRRVPILGHVVIPELNAADYKADKTRFTLIKEQLAIVASEPENIVRYPAGYTESD